MRQSAQPYSSPIRLRRGPILMVVAVLTFGGWSRPGAAAAAATDAEVSPAVAFPGAEGFGAHATGGRGGVVLVVDSTADNPKSPAPHTLRWACESVNGPRIVVFRTGGIIDLQRTIDVRNPDLTLAAQTAPGNGICLRGSGLSIEASNVIVRGLRSRPGDGKAGTSAQYRRSIQIIGPVSDVIVDHCTAGWGIDDDMTIYADPEGHAARNVTVQWCLLAECLYHSIHQQGPHSMAMTMGGGNIGPLSFHHNLLAHNNGRNPRIVWGAEGELVNNVIYNWGGQSTVLEPFNPVKVKKDKRRPEDSKPMRLDFIGNTWIPGADSSDKRSEIVLNHVSEGTSIYMKGNVGPSRPQDVPGKNEAALLGKARSVLSDKPAVGASTVTAQPASEAKDAILKAVGATAPARDAIDTRVIESVRAGTGKIIDSPSQVGGYPDYPAGAPPKDTDADGMPDDWEAAHGLDPHRANGNGHDLSTVYDNVEVYINSLLPSEPTAR